MTGEELHVFATFAAYVYPAFGPCSLHVLALSQSPSKISKPKEFHFIPSFLLPGKSQLTMNWMGWENLVFPLLPRGNWNCLGEAIILDGCSGCLYWWLLSKAYVPSQSRDFPVHKNERLLTPLELGIKLSFCSSLSEWSATTSENHRKHYLRSYLEKRILVIDSYIWSSISDSCPIPLPIDFCYRLLNCIWIRNISLHLMVFIKHVLLLPQYHY